jgi:outer membrane protein TolC
MKSFPVYIFSLALLLTLSMQSQAAEQILTLSQAMKQVQQHPSLMASQASAEALAFTPAQVGGLPDPVLSVGAISFPVDTFNRGQENMTQLQVGISQAFPFPGTLDLAAQAGTHLAEAARFDVDEQRLQLVNRVQHSWWNVFYLDKALEAVSHNKQLLKQLVRIAESKYKTGKGLQQDVLLAQLELSKLLDIEIQMTSAREQEVIRLNNLLNRPSHQAIHLPAEVDVALPQIPEQHDLLQQASLQRPRLAKQQQLIEAAQAKVSLADKAYYPDFKLGASYGLRAANAATGLDRADLASITLSMSLPFFGDTQDAAAGEQQASLARQGFAFDDAKQAVASEIAQAKASYKQNKAQASLFKSGIIPQARQTVASMRAAYQVNKVDFLNLMRAQITLYNYETQYWKALAGAKQALASLDAAVGKTMENTHE